MKNKYIVICVLFVFLTMFFYGSITFAGGDESKETAEKILNIQLDAIVKGDHQKFIQPGNEAFKKMYDEWHFDTLKSRLGYKLKKGYTLKYLGSLKRLSAKQHLWKVRMAGDKYEYLARISITYGKVYGFEVD